MDPIVFAQLNEAYHKGVYSPEETLSEEEYLDIQEWVESLIEEGYDLDRYTDDELYEAYLAEELTGSRATRAVKKDAKLMRRIQSGDKTPGLRDKRHTIHRLLKPSDDRTSFGRGNKALRRMGYTPTEGGTFFNPFNEELDLYDLVSEYLVSEGFCDSYEDADVIMANMSEEWREGIVEEVLEEFKPTGYSMGYHSPETGRGKKARQIDSQIKKLKMSGKRGQAQAVDFVNRMQDTPEGRSEVMATSRRNKSKLDARARRDAQRDSRG